MKFSTTHAIAGIAILVVLMQLAKRRKATAKPNQGPIDGAQQWWTYAGSWNVPTP